jgi:hypothetical protein
MGPAQGADTILVYQDKEMLTPGWKTPLTSTILNYRIQSAYARKLFIDVDLDTKYRNFPAHVQAWFTETINSFGYDPEIIKPNNDLRQMLKGAGDEFGDTPFQLGGYTW